MKTYIQVDPDNIQTSETHENGSSSSGIVRRAETKTRQVQDGTEEVSAGFDDDGVEIFKSNEIFITQTYSPWRELLDAASLGDVVISWLDMQEWKTEQDAKQTAQAQRVEKAKGILYQSEQISLSEANQNGIAAIVAGEALAVEFETTVFPLSFNAETAGGARKIPFDNIAAFKSFACKFMSARQKFFI
jgi:hypothetical protein